MHAHTPQAPKLADSEENQCLSFEVSLRITRLCRHLKYAKKEPHIHNELFQSGGKLALFFRQAEYACTPFDFLSKVREALDACEACRYWLQMLIATQTLSAKSLSALQADVEKLRQILKNVYMEAQHDLEVYDV